MYIVSRLKFKIFGLYENCLMLSKLISKCPRECFKKKNENVYKFFFFGISSERFSESLSKLLPACPREPLGKTIEKKNYKLSTFLKL